MWKCVVLGMGFCLVLFFKDKGLLELFIYGGYERFELSEVSNFFLVK